MEVLIDKKEGTLKIKMNVANKWGWDWNICGLIEESALRAVQALIFFWHLRWQGMRKRNRVTVALSHLHHLHWVGLFRKLKVPDCASSNGKLVMKVKEKQGSAISGFNSLSLSPLHSETHTTTETQMLTWYCQIVWFWIFGMIEIEMMKESFSKLLLGEHMSGCGNGVCNCMALLFVF